MVSSTGAGARKGGVGGVMVSIVAFQAVDPGSIPGQRKPRSLTEAQWPIGYGVGLRIKRSSVRIRPWPLR